MTVGLELTLLYHDASTWTGFSNLLIAAFLIFLSLALVTSLALLFSTFSTPALSALFTFFLWVIGHFSKDLLQFGELSRVALIRWICTGIYYAIPNLSVFKIMDSRYILQDIASYRQTDPLLIAAIILYFIAYSAVILALSIWVFLRRDFK
jgi:Cu-processing system permease protein